VATAASAGVTVAALVAAVVVSVDDEDCVSEALADVVADSGAAADKVVSADVVAVAEPELEEPQAPSASAAAAAATAQAAIRGLPGSRRRRRRPFAWI
jgi:hypothetical protein